MAEHYRGAQRIDFAGLAAALLDRAPTLVPQWLPNGIERNGRWYVGDFDGSPGESANVNLLTGQWIDNAAPDQDKGGDLISLYARIHGLNNGQAALALMRDMGWERSQGPPPPSQASALSAAPAAKPAKRKTMWRAVVPVPATVAKPGFTWGYQDKASGNYVELEPVRTWEYAFEGQLFGYVARFERVNSGGELVKDTLPRTWCVDESDDRGSHKWHWKAWDTPRPLYVPATLLSGDLSLPVVIVEGEKCAEAGHQLLGHEFDFVSWPGGCKTWSLAAWGWLMGRTVYLWPDCDAKRERLSAAERQADVDPATKALLAEHKQPGMAAMVGIGALLMREQGCTVHLCKIPKPGAVSDGWDIADAVAQGWDAEQVRAFIRGAGVFVPPAEEPKKSARSSANAGQGGTGDPPRHATEVIDDEPAHWWECLQFVKGKIASVRENVVLALDGWPSKGVQGIETAAGLIAFNQFTNNVEKTAATPWGTASGAWLEVDELMMGDWLVRQHGMPSMARASLEEAALIVAHRHAFHPVRQKFEARRGLWDKVERLDTWLRVTCLEEDEYDDKDPLQQYLTLAGRWFVMGMVARVLPQVKQGARVVRGPGTKFDYMLVFEGPQGEGKSTLASVLGGEHFADTGLDLGNKDSYQNIQGVSVYEWPELDNMSKQEVSKVKLFISSTKDRFRASFDRRPADYPRQVVFVGTTNEAHYLTDMTGNRRFWPVRTTLPPDSDWLRENLDQLISEALFYLDRGDRFWPTRDEQRELFTPQQHARTVESSIESAIRRFLYDEDQKTGPNQANGAFLNQITMQELMERIGYTIDKQTDVVVKRAGAVMHMLGWEVKRTSLPGRPRVYVRPKDKRLAQPSNDSSTGPTQGTPEDDDEIPF